MTYQWHFESLIQFWHLWVSGLLSTIYLAVLSIVMGTAIGLLVAVGLNARSPFLRALVRGYVDLFRAIPVLVLLGTLYFCLPIVIRLRMGQFGIAVIAMTLNLAPFVAECIRSAMQSVPRIQYDSAFVFGFHGWKLGYYIIWPQVLRRLIPPLVGQYITTLKLTSLAATIGVQELWNITSQITTLTSLPLEAKLAGAGLYVAIIFPLLWLSYWLERRFGVLGLGELRER